MGQASRTTKVLLALGKRTQGGANTEKRAALDATSAVLTQARAFYIDFFLAHTDKLAEKVTYYSEEHLEMRERLLSAHELLTWAEACTVATASHPHPWPGWNFSERFAGMPFAYRPLDLETLDTRAAFVRIHVYTAEGWQWMHYPVNSSRYLVQRLLETDWQRQSPTLVLRAHAAELHIPQVKKIVARKVMERKQDPDLVTVAIDLNVKNLAVITVRQHGQIIETVFVRDHGLDAHRYRHLKRIAKKQWLSGKPVKGEHSNQQLWRHIDRLNEDAAHKVASRIASVCASYPGCILLFERLRKIKPGKGSKSRRMNRKRANQLRGKINQHARDKAYVEGVVTVEVNPHGTSQYCSRCGAKGERFSYRGGKRIKEPWGKLFVCPVCHYEANADFNASVNVHRSFYREWHWQPRKAQAPPSPIAEGD